MPAKKPVKTLLEMVVNLSPTAYIHTFLTCDPTPGHLPKEILGYRQR